jgi:MFS family permease
VARSEEAEEHVASGDATGMLHSVRLYPAFRMLLLGTLATNTAFWMYQTCAGWLALQLTDSPFFVGLAGFAGGIPLLIISLPAGVLIDRHDRRLVLMFAQFGVMGVAAAFAALVGADLIRPWSMLVLVALYGGAMSFVFPVRNAIVGSVVERGHLGNAVALNAATQNATRVVGPSLAGVLIAVVGISGTFAVAAALQVLALMATYRLPVTRSEPSTRATTTWESLTLGLRIVAASPKLSALIMLALAPTVLVMPYINLMPVFARDQLDLGSTGLGLLLAAAGLGTVAGALSVARSQRLRSRRGAQLVTASAFSVLVMVFSVTPNAIAATLLLFAAGWMSAAYLAINQTSLQLSVADEVRGRVLSIYLLTWGMLPLGQLAVGTLANATGTPAAMVTSCLAGLLCIGLIARRFPSLRM